MASAYTISREYFIETIPVLIVNLNVVESIVKGSSFPASAFTAYNKHFMKSYNITEKLKKTFEMLINAVDLNEKLISRNIGGYYLSRDKI
jgi:hypothetical protein